MSTSGHKNPQYGLRVPTPIMDKIKYIAWNNGRTANKEIERAMIEHIAAFEKEYGVIDAQCIDEAPITRKS